VHVHGVCVSLKDGSPEEAFESVVDKLSSIVGKVDGVIEVHGGLNKSDHPSEYTHVIAVLMERHSVLAEYRVHPLHEEAMKELVAIVDKGVSLDVGDA